MVIDTSALLTIVQAEPERQQFLGAMERAPVLRMSVVSLVESSMLIESRYRSDAVRDFDQFMAKARIELIPVDRDQAEIARSAFARFGKGRHRAALNLGDCFAYALAMAFGEPLLFKGGDFVHTDVMIAPF